MLKGQVIVALMFVVGLSQAQGYWQQHVDYTMEIDFDNTNHQFAGSQRLVYTNNSPDTLDRIFYHLYFNAFQPGSAMDVRSRNIVDPDPRIGDRISKLKPDEFGYHQITSLKQDGNDLKSIIEGTVMTVWLKEALLPGESTSLEMSFQSQVPVQIRRSGRNNSEGVDYTMTQWYPKLAEYDRDGWHTDPYVGREFHGVFGSFDVKINIDAAYILCGTGLQQDDMAASDRALMPEGKKQWHFKADNVHDFAWAADPNFVHTSRQVPNGPVLNFYRLNDTSIVENWEKMEPEAVRLFEIMNATFGKYPYEQFSVIQAGDGGMEYPMCTMISGTGSLGGLISVTVHEAIHNWYYGVLATHELKYPWMDEGFTTYAQNFVLDSLRGRGNYNPNARSYKGFINYVTKVSEEPLTTHADHYITNSGYGVAAYSKGCIFLNQLRFIIGDEDFEKSMVTYFNQWKFKHPTPQDFKRVLEKQSGMELDWYFEEWIGTNHQIDLSISSVTKFKKQTIITVKRVGEMPMPAHIRIKTKTGVTDYFIPIVRMRTPDLEKNGSTVLPPWQWPNETYDFTIDVKIKDIEAIILDPEGMLADVDPLNGVYPKPRKK